MGYSALHAGLGDSESQRSAGSYSQRSLGCYSQQSSMDGPAMSRLKGALPKKPFQCRSSSSNGQHHDNDRSYMHSVLRHVSEQEGAIKQLNQKMTQMHEALARMAEANTNRALHSAARILVVAPTMHASAGWPSHCPLFHCSAL